MTVTQQIHYVVNDHMQLALHSWLPKKTLAAMFYVHGIQSHAGWMFETGELFAKKGIAVYVLDRRGSGISEGLRGDIASKYGVLQDYRCALDIVVNQNQFVPLTLFGQSMGGSILAGLVSQPDFKINYNNIFFCATALGKRYSQLDEENRNKMLAETSTEQISINLRDEDYTDTEAYLQFIKTDSLALKTITKRSAATMLAIEMQYLAATEILKNKSAVYLCPEIDPIVDLTTSINIFQKLAGQTGIVKSFATNKHYLWFTDQKLFLIDWIANFILAKE